MKEKRLYCEKTLKKSKGSKIVKMLAAALLPLLWPLAAAQADQGDQGVGGVHLAFVGDDDGNHDGSCSSRSR